MADSFLKMNCVSQALDSVLEIEKLNSYVAVLKEHKADIGRQYTIIIQGTTEALWRAITQGEVSFRVTGGEWRLRVCVNRGFPEEWAFKASFQELIGLAS